MACRFGRLSRGLPKWEETNADMLMHSIEPVGDPAEEDRWLSEHVQPRETHHIGEPEAPSSGGRGTGVAKGSGLVSR